MEQLTTGRLLSLALRARRSRAPGHALRREGRIVGEIAADMIDRPARAVALVQMLLSPQWLAPHPAQRALPVSQSFASDRS